jgi:hypothetical protein
MPSILPASLGERASTLCQAPSLTLEDDLFFKMACGTNQAASVLNSRSGPIGTMRRLIMG